MVELDPNAFQTGYDQGQNLIGGIQKQKAALGAGRAIASGDYSGAVQALGGSGDVQGALQVGQLGAQQGQMQRQQQQEGLTALLHMAQGLKRVPADQRPHAYQTVIAPLLQRQGLDQAHIDAMAQSTMDDQTLDATISALGGEVQKLTAVKPGESLYDATSGKAVYSAPDVPHYMAVPAGGELVNTTAMAQGGGGGVSPVPPAGAVSGPAGRNNNPGNLRWDGKSKWQGMTGVDPGGFVQFDTPENGTRAAGINLQNQSRLHGLDTLTAIITKYAPASDRNDTNGYIQSVAQQTGLDPNAPLNLNDPAVVQKITRAMFNVEGGGTPARVPAPPVAAGGNPNIITGPPKATARPATAAEKAAYGLSPSTPAQMKPDGSIDVISGADTSELDDVAVDQLAQAFNITHVLPSFGNGGGSARVKILNRAADLQKAGGKDGADLVQSGAAYKANVGALSDVTKSYARISAGEANVNSLADQLLGQVKSAGLSGQSPAFNGTWRDAKNKFAGDAKMAGIVETMGVLRDDYAIVMAGSNGQSSDSLRADMDERINKAQNMGQLTELATQMKTSMANRKAAYLGEITDLTGQISGKGKAGLATGMRPAPAAPNPAANPAITEHQHHAASVHYVPGAKAGERGNPYTPTSQKEFEYIQNGQFYVDTDGALVQKR